MLKENCYMKLIQLSPQKSRIHSFAALSEITQAELVLSQIAVDQFFVLSTSARSLIPPGTREPVLSQIAVDQFFVLSTNARSLIPPGLAPASPS